MIEAIENHPNLHVLELEGNTIGVEAAKGIGEALSKHPNLQRARWKDMFTGRLRQEIPDALVSLTNSFTPFQSRSVASVYALEILLQSLNILFLSWW